MYKVHFFFPDLAKEFGETKPCIAQFSSDIEAVQFALSLHQVSNVHHCIKVEDPQGEYVCHFFKSKE